MSDEPWRVRRQLTRRRLYRIVGWTMDTNMRTELILDALPMAVTQRQPSGVIHHSDRGSQYTSTAFGKRCREANIMPSMGTVGDA